MGRLANVFLVAVLLIGVITVAATAYQTFVLNNYELLFFDEEE